MPKLYKNGTLVGQKRDKIMRIGRLEMYVAYDHPSCLYSRLQLLYEITVNDRLLQSPHKYGLSCTEAPFGRTLRFEKCGRVNAGTRGKSLDDRAYALLRR